MAGEGAHRSPHAGLGAHRFLNRSVPPPALHRDPFDRILIAQALAEGLTLATKDAMLSRYGVPVVWE